MIRLAALTALTLTLVVAGKAFYEAWYAVHGCRCVDPYDPCAADSTKVD